MLRSLPNRNHRRVFTTNELAEYAYCAISWWFQQFSPLAQSSDEVLFAHMVEIEHEYGSQATIIPEYIVAEQLLLRRGAFERGRAQHTEQTQVSVEREETPLVIHVETHRTRRLTLMAVVLLVLSLILLLGGGVLRINVFFPAGLGALSLAIILFLLLLNERRAQARNRWEERRQTLGLPQGKLVYEGNDEQADPLASQAYPLAGKPDYIVQLPDGRPVPIERKLHVSEAIQPYNNHVVLVAASCLILEEYSQKPPTHGMLHYADRAFTIEYTPALRRRVLRLIQTMEQATEQKPPDLTSQIAAKCRACAFQALCPVGRGK